MLRILSGQFRGRSLVQPPPSLTRPTSQRTRAAIFNILRHHPHVHLTGATVLDAFAGSGALGLEALSQGAQFVTFVESHPKVLPGLHENIARLHVETTTQLYPLDILALPTTSQPVDLIFMDPPYEQEIAAYALTKLREKNWLDATTWVILEISANKDFTPPPPLIIVDSRTYGAAQVLILTPTEI